MRRIGTLSAVPILIALAIASTTSGAIAADQIRLSSVKLGVGDFKRSIAFYTKYIGMSVGPQYIPAEQQLYWKESPRSPGIVLVHDDTGKLKLAPGGGWVVIQVPSIEKAAADFRAGGIQDFDKFSQPVSATVSVQVILVKDPDGNQLELLELPESLSK